MVFWKLSLKKPKKSIKALLKAIICISKMKDFITISLLKTEILREIVKKIMQDEDFNALMTKYEVKNNHGIYVGFLLGSLC